jgi:adenylosuccinate synthase
LPNLPRLKATFFGIGPPYAEKIHRRDSRVVRLRQDLVAASNEDPLARRPPVTFGDSRLR